MNCCFSLCLSGVWRVVLGWFAAVRWLRGIGLGGVDRKYHGFGRKGAIICGCHKSRAQDVAHFSFRVVTLLFAFDVVVQGQRSV